MKMSSIIDQKKALRKTVRALKDAMSEELRMTQEQAIFEAIEQMPEFQVASNVLIYWSMPDEVNTHAFIEKWWRHKKIFLPIIDDEQLQLGLFEGVDKMSVGAKYGIAEPVTMPLNNYDDITFAIIPGVAFDENGYRLGRGGGFYDRFLPQLLHAFKTGIGYREQKVDSVPVSEFDVKLNHVVFG